MILRKPYAFLIRYFKIIHLILTCFSVYFAYIIGRMLNYYNNFIDSSVGKLDAINYINSFYVFIVILSLIICLVVITLMKYKKKSYLFYIVLIVYYMLVAFLINYSMSGLYSIYVSSVDIKSLLLHRDILKISSFIQYIFIGMTLVRGLGFDLKKFNFADDLIELNIDVSDDEEVELTVGNFSKLKRKLNRNFREFRYTYLENRVFFRVLFVAILVGIFGWYFVDSMILNRVYKTSDVFEFDGFKFKVLNSYITNIGSDGRKISGDNNYVVIKMDVINEGAIKNINTGNLILEIDGNKYSNKVISSLKFSDLGVLYRDQKVKGTKTYIFVYSVADDINYKDMMLLYRDDKKVKLKPIYLDKLQDYVDYNVGNIININETILGDGSFNIKSFDLKDSFDYSYEYEMLGEMYTGNITISSVNGIIINLDLDNSYITGLDLYSFLDKYADLKYIVDGVEYKSRVFDNKTPGSYKNGLFIAVDKEILNSSSIWFDIKVRNKQYKYKLK